MITPLLSAQVQGVIDERSAVYGEPLECFSAIAEIWSAMIKHTWGVKELPGPITAKDVALMMAAMKLLRATRQFKDDNFVDCAAFVSFAQRAQATGNGTPQ